MSRCRGAQGSGPRRRTDQDPFPSDDRTHGSEYESTDLWIEFATDAAPGFEAAGIVRAPGTCGGDDAGYSQVGWPGVPASAPIDQDGHTAVIEGLTGLNGI